jgi:predicted ABC-type exoprotein transport system permease subunit
MDWSRYKREEHMEQVIQRKTYFGTVAVFIGLGQMLSYPFLFAYIQITRGEIETIIYLLIALCGFCLSVKGLRIKEENKMATHAGFIINLLFIFFWAVNLLEILFS